MAADFPAALIMDGLNFIPFAKNNFFCCSKAS
jgi:hypothetical protein